MALDAYSRAILQAVILGVGVENNVIVLDAVCEISVAAVAGRQAVHGPDRLALEAGPGEGLALGFLGELATGHHTPLTAFENIIPITPTSAIPTAKAL
jgi:hypothetical protein